MNEQLEMYQENILDHYKEPCNKKMLDKYSHTFRELNPLCGDEITLYLLVENGNITDVSFQGHGCAISQASVSMLTEKIKGMNLEDVMNLGKDDIFEMLGIPISHTRLKCALLSLKVLHNALEVDNVRN